MADLVKIGISFPVAGAAEAVCVELSHGFARLVTSDVRLGSAGNSIPHVTVAMGLIEPDRRTTLEVAVGRLVPALGGPFAMSFGPVYREQETGRYVFVDAGLPPVAARWRADAQRALAEVFAEPSRTSEVPHVTLTCTGQPTPELDDSIRRAPRVPPVTVDRVDIALGGPKGTKLDVLHTIPLR